MTVTQQDINSIVIAVLLQAVRRFETNLIGATIEHIVYRDDVEIGRIVIHPGVFGLAPTGSYKPTATEEIDRNTFIYICQRIQNEIDLLIKAAKMHTMQQTGADDGQQGKAGRKPDQFYDQAFEMIRKGTPKADARQWFFEQSNIIPDLDGEKAFNTAMRRRRKATK